MTDPVQIKIPLKDATGIHVEIYEKSPDTLFILDEQEAVEYGESPYQLMEGCSYEYLLPAEYSLEASEIVIPSKINPNHGYIHTNIYVGTLDIGILHKENPIAKLNLEVRSVKTEYRTHYRKMLEDITQKCTDLLLRQSSIIHQTFTVDITKDPQTLYQRFAFVESIIRSESFSDSMHRINSSPVKRWESVQTHKNITKTRRVNSSVIRQIITSNNRTTLSEEHPLKNKYYSLPNKINLTDNIETTDIPENRFIKYVLQTFMQFCLSIYQHPNAKGRLKKDALASSELLAKYLNLPIFKEVSSLDMIPLHSPVLQRKEGYREILQTYLMFDMAASLIWRGGDDVYKAGKRDVAVLYEYWLFFKLLDLMEEIFKIKPRSIDEIIQIKDHGLELSLRQGKQKMIEGIFEADNRQLNIRFCYNRNFTSQNRYPNGGSWTSNMSPDYTLSIWPKALSEQQAEEKETIVHIHFDAKYKIDNYQNLFDDTDHNDEKQQQAKGIYKRADLLKMHAYKDAIRRTAGAYVLYPGTENKTYNKFHELLPGLGAFAISPTNSNNTGLKEFLLDVVQHFLNRATQRELYSFRTFDTFRDLPGPKLKGTMPDNGAELPAITYVLIGYYKDQAHLDWILKNKLYNVRTDFRTGSIKLSQETTGAKYLLLHTKGAPNTDLIYRLSPDGPRVISREFLQRKKYPSLNIKPYYIAYSLTTPDSLSNHFACQKWDISKLKGYKPGRASAMLFVVTLEELMHTINKD